MRLFHQRNFPRPGPLSKSDEEECFTTDGRRQGVYLTDEPLAGEGVLTMEAPEAELADYEVSADGSGRAFVVPFQVLRELGSTSKPS